MSNQRNRVDYEILKVLDLNEETGQFYWKISSGKAAVGKKAGVINGQGYVQIRYRNVTYLAHRLVWLFLKGEYPAGLLDHKDRNRSNNRITNLREVTSQQNQTNRLPHKNCSSKYKGVTVKPNGRSRSSITHLGIRYDLGCFLTEEAAALAYNSASRELHGAYGYLNVIDLEDSNVR